ncbi:hypothetical protein E2320_021576, partial [Naja naja]
IGQTPREVLVSMLQKHSWTLVVAVRIKGNQHNPEHMKQLLQAEDLEIIKNQLLATMFSEIYFTFDRGYGFFRMFQVVSGERHIAMSDDELLFECTGHKDSVTCVGFSYDSTFMATSDMGGFIKVWQVDAKEEIWSFEVTWSGQNGIPRPNCLATCGCVLPDGRRAVVGYEDRTVCIWDLKQGNSLHVLKGNEGQQGPLTCVASQKDGSLILTGSVDCHAKLINSATGKVVSVFKAESKPAAEEEAESNSMESLGFCNVMPLAAIGYLDGTLAIYDLAMQTLRHKCQHESGIVQLLWEESSAVVYTCSLDGAVRLWDACLGKLISEYRGHSAEILDFALNKKTSALNADSPNSGHSTKTPEENLTDNLSERNNKCLPRISQAGSPDQHSPKMDQKIVDFVTVSTLQDSRSSEQNCMSTVEDQGIISKGHNEEVINDT